ncbi:hypothetical protein PMAYCL1PPCAC_02208, partial [Pristionchus mayeri]
GMNRDPAEPTACDICGKMMRKDSLYKHRRMHSDESESRRPFKCDECGGRFTSAKILIEHKRIHLDDIEERLPFKCTHCERRFAQLFMLRSHEMSH